MNFRKTNYYLIITLTKIRRISLLQLIQADFKPQKIKLTRLKIK